MPRPVTRPHNSTSSSEPFHFVKTSALNDGIDPVAVDRPLLDGHVVHAARDEMRQLDAVHRLVVAERHLERRLLRAWWRADRHRAVLRRHAGPITRGRRPPRPRAISCGATPCHVIISGMCVV